VRAITEQILGRCPTGIKRALGNLPSRVMTPENYRRLVALLADPDTAKLLHHARSINNSMIETLHGLPAPLRHPFMVDALESRVCAAFSDGLRLLVSRGAASSFDALVQELSFISQSGQFFTKLKGIVEALPLPPALPPVQVGEARRLDQPDTIRTLAKNWRNCLVSYLNEIDAGTCAVYLWNDSYAPAACLVRKYSRLGWFLEQVKGPQNVDIEPEQLAKIHSAFANVGIPERRVIIAINSMILEADKDERHLRHIEQRQRANQYFLPDPEVLDLAAI
jgi:hypothetical protein